MLVVLPYAIVSIHFFGGLSCVRVCVCDCSHSKRKSSKGGNLVVPVLVGEMSLHSGSVEVSEGVRKWFVFLHCCIRREVSQRANCSTGTFQYQHFNVLYAECFEWQCRFFLSLHLFLAGCEGSW